MRLLAANLIRVYEYKPDRTANQRNFPFSLTNLCLTGKPSDQSTMLLDSLPEELLERIFSFTSQYT